MLQLQVQITAASGEKKAGGIELVLYQKVL